MLVAASLMPHLRAPVTLCHNDKATKLIKIVFWFPTTMVAKLEYCFGKTSSISYLLVNLMVFQSVNLNLFWIN